MASVFKSIKYLKQYTDRSRNEYCSVCTKHLFIYLENILILTTYIFNTVIHKNI